MELSQARWVLFKPAIKALENAVNLGVDQSLGKVPGRGLTRIATYPAIATGLTRGMLLG